MAQSATIIPPADRETEPVTQSNSLAMTFEDLLGSGDAPEETADEIIQAVRQWRDTPSGGGITDGLRH